MYTDTGGVVTQDQRYNVQRRQPRFLFSVPVSISRLGESGQPVTHGLSLDLSRSGASALLCGPATVGETVRLSLQFPEAPVESLAIVRHSDSTRSGFEFLDLAPAHQRRLQDCIQTLQVRPWQPEWSGQVFIP